MMNKIYLFIPVLALMFSCTNKPSIDDKKIKETPNIVSDSISNKEIIEVIEQPVIIDSTVLKAQIDTSVLTHYSQEIITSKGDTFNLNVPNGFELSIVKEGFKRLRFMDESPDGRLFLTDMYNLSDNKKGKVYILDDFNEDSNQFLTKHTWVNGLRNPNDVKFYKDTAGQDWIYIAQTHAVVRYKYTPGEIAPSSEAEIVVTFPDYGLSYKYGGWHLTRSMDFYNDKLYVSIGSSCNSCEEKESERERASIIELNPDGTAKRFFAEGLRNAVEIKWVNDIFFATNMGSDHFGKEKPDDQFLIIEDGVHYGWPYCYQDGWELKNDTTKQWERKNMRCEDVPKAYQPLGAHIAPLGFDYFSDFDHPSLNNYFLIAHHGSVTLRKGWEIVRVKDGKLDVFIDGFRGEGKTKNGRPCDIYRFKDGFLFTDDYKGILYYVRKK